MFPLRVGRYQGAALDNDEYELPLDQELSTGLARHGYRLDDVPTVILTHLHEDHAGFLRDLPRARVVISWAEQTGRFTKAFGVVPIIYSPRWLVFATGTS